MSYHSHSCFQEHNRRPNLRSPSSHHPASFPVSVRPGYPLSREICLSRSRADVLRCPARAAPTDRTRPYKPLIPRRDLRRGYGRAVEITHRAAQQQQQHGCSCRFCPRPPSPDQTSCRPRIMVSIQDLLLPTEAEPSVRSRGYPLGPAAAAATAAGSTHFRIEFILDTICPHCYIGLKNLTAAIQIHQEVHPEDSFEVTFSPIILNRAASRSGK